MVAIERIERSVEADWSGTRLLYESAPATYRDHPMSAYSFAIAYRPIERVWWRLGTGSSRSSALEVGSVSLYGEEDFIFAPAAQGYHCLMVSLEKGFLERTALAMGAVPPHGVRPVHFGRDPELASIADLMRGELTRGEAGGAVYRESLLTLFGVHLLRRYADSAAPDLSPASGLSPARARQVLDHMHEHLARPLSLEELASVACLSPYHFLRSFRAMFGCPPHRYLTRLRMERARALLSRSSVPVSEVARNVGYASPSHFALHFRRHLGVTPTTFRKIAAEPGNIR